MFKKLKTAAVAVAMVGAALLGGCSAEKSDVDGFIGDWSLVAVEATDEEFSM